jgi:hypothetical protein
MMKTYLKTYVMIGAFFASLLALWGLEYAGVRTDKEKRLRDTRLLPELIDVNEGDIRVLTIERGSEQLVFERRGPGVGRWQMVAPKNVAAEPTRLETLVRNLKEMRRSLDSGSVTGPADSFGLAPPVATVRLWGERTNDDSQTEKPMATLVVGKTVRGVRYVRPGGAEAIEGADGKLLSAVDLPMADWREHVVMGIPTFQVATATITRDGQVIRVERTARGEWVLTAPVKAPANSAKVESLLAALASLRVVDQDKGFIADDVKDLAPFGLAAAGVTVELTTTHATDPPLILHVGKPVPGQPDRIYVRQGDQDDVVAVDSKALSEIPTTAIALRSQQVADIEPAAVTRIEIKTRVDMFALKKGATGWELTEPRAEKADNVSVNSFLKGMDGLQTSEFLPVDQVKNLELDPPVMTIKIWEKRAVKSAGGSPTADPALVLRVGKHDVLRKTVFARLENDQAVLALPDTILEVLPRNMFAFRDLSILSLNPADVRKLTLLRGDRTDEVEPARSGEPNRWRMRQPVDAPADTRTVTQILALLANLRADQLVTDSVGDGKLFGLDRPQVEVTWETDRTHRLKIGAPVPRAGAFYAKVEDLPFVFTIKAEVLKPLVAQLRDHSVLSFPLAKAQRLVLTWGWPPRTAAFKRRSATAKGQSDWVDEPGTDAAGLDQSRIGSLVKSMSQLETDRFAQYDGEIQPYTGLNRPRLIVEVVLGSGEPTRVLKIGSQTNDGNVFAAEGTSGAGPVFLLPASAWEALIQSGERMNPLPADVFSHTP